MKREWGSNFDRQNSLLKRNWQLSSRPGSRSARFKNIPNECKRTHGTVEYVCVYPQVVPSSNTEHTINVLWAQRKKSYYTVFFRYTTIFDKQSRREREKREWLWSIFLYNKKQKEIFQMNQNCFKTLSIFVVHHFFFWQWTLFTLEIVRLNEKDTFCAIESEMFRKWPFLVLKLNILRPI